jgi:ABC-2 type transport system ATP-binding protein
MNPIANAIEVRDLVKVFGHFQAVKGIHFNVKQGEILGFLGPNGAGKTTTIKMITGLLKVTSGSILVNGLDNQKHMALIKNKLGYMSQKFSLYPLLTVLENIEFFGGISGLTRRELRDQATRIAAQLPAELLRQRIQALPPGIRQQVALFVCLLSDPEIILLDEPTSGVDPAMRRRFWNEIYQLKKNNKTLLVTTHNLDEAEYCDRVMIIHNGEIVLQGEPAELLRQNRRTSVEELFKQVISAHGQN